MKLLSARIENFKCIEDTGDFSIAPVTCLVGKNESGKTAILQALYKLNADMPENGNFYPLQEYPRRNYSTYKERHASEPDNVLTTVWELDDADIEEIQGKIGLDAIKKHQITLKKDYNNKLSWNIEIDESKIIQHYIDSSGINLEDFEEIREATSIKSLIERIDARIIQLREGISEKEGEESGVQRKIDLLNSLKLSFTDIFPEENPDPHKVISDILKARLPKFLYFAEYQKMPGQVSIDDLKNKKSENRLSVGDKIFLALLDLAGSSIDEIDKMDKYEALRAELEAVSSRLSKEIFEYWTQNKHLDVRFEFDSGRPGDPAPYNTGYIFRTRIWNTRHQVSVNFDERSTGFVWFFSFLVCFSQVRKNFGENVIILLDEPALNLHAKAQSDLLRYIEERLKPNHQVIYTTHSPFMIDPDNILSARTVEDKVTDTAIEGTKVGDRIFSTDADTLFPLQRVLGYEIAQTLFIGKNTLLVEGPSDVLYLKWFSQLLQQNGRKYLDPRWVIAPCGGIDKMMSFVKLFSANMLNIAALVDYSEGQKKKIQRFRDSDYINADRILSAEKYVDASEADIEDIIGRSMYIDLVNKMFELNDTDALSSIRSSEAPERVIKEVEDHLQKLTNSPDFNHYKPANYLMDQGKEFSKELSDSDEALDRFENIFIELNKFLE